MKLEAQGICRRFFRSGKNTNFFYAVEKMDFSLAEGSFTQIVGRSGSGKSTFLNLLCGLLRPTEGHVLLDGQDLYALPDEARSALRNRHIGVVPQGQTGLQSLTVLENVLLPAAMYGSAADAQPRAVALLESVGIGELTQVYADELSGGELRRMAIARALINSPQIILADEPTADLDDETTAQVLRLLRQCAERGSSVLMITHEKDALRYADRVYRMERGVLTPYDEAGKECL